MAKRTVQKNSKPVDMQEDELGLKSEKYITTGGIEITLSGLPPLMVPMIAGLVDYPDKPTYTFKDGAGVEVTAEHDEKSLITDEDKLAWAKYEEEYDKADNLMTQKLLDLVLMEGVAVSIENFERWKHQQEIIGIPVPEDVDEMMMMYKRGKVIRSGKDIAHVMRRCMELTGVNPEEVTAIKKSFPD